MKYTETHEWIEEQGSAATVGVSDYAQKELGDIVYIELPQKGIQVKAGDVVCVLESTKAAADVYSPVSGTISAVNEKLKEQPELINRSAESEGWIYKIQVSSPQELEKLLDKKEYYKK